jgi:hypothetical protein
MPKTEALTKASHSAAFALGDLRSALATATATEALLLLPLIEQAAQLQQRVDALLGAIKNDGK